MTLQAAHQASFALPNTFRGRNPDVLTCIANLSNDEVWTCNGFVPVTYLIMPPSLRMRAG
jgi:hypothetical protein